MDAMNGNMFKRILDYSNKNPWLYAVYVVLVGLPTVLIITFCCSGSGDKTGEAGDKSSLNDPKKTDEPQEDDEAAEEEAAAQEEAGADGSDGEEEEEEEEEEEDEPPTTRSQTRKRRPRKEL